jgi:predicted lipid-binding transport protein (Tim44 family)
MLVRFVMRRFVKPSPGLQLAGAGNTGGSWNVARTAEPGFGSAPIPVQNAAPSVPAGFDTAGFERAAKLIFIRMQAANDAADLNDLRQFSTPEMFAAFRLDLQDRHSAPQRTDVLQVEAHILDVTEEAGQQIVSVRFDGLLREEPQAPATPFDEVWHLVRPKDGSREWAIAGIEQTVH